MHFTVTTASSVGDICVSVVMGDVRLANHSTYAVTASSLASLL